jgi:hypothetical protein
MLGLSLSLVCLAGCSCYRGIVDPCWPQRYEYQARESVHDATNAQANNGHVLDQTIWNYHFEHDPKTGAPSDRLNPAGIEKLNLISRRRPAPDTHIFLATAQDIPGLAALVPEKALAERKDLNDRRFAAIQRYLAIQSSTAVVYNIEIHDPAEVGIAAMPITGSAGVPRQVQGAYQKYQNGFDGTMANPAGGGSSSSSSTSSTSSSSSGSGSAPR